MNRISHCIPLFLILLSACAGNPQPLLSEANTNSASSMTGSYLSPSRPSQNARFFFRTPDFFSLTSANPQTGCAGDATLFYDAQQMDSNGNPLLLENGSSRGSTTLPSFITNVSLDLTHSALPGMWNQASHCTTNSKMVSNCASLDSDPLEAPEGSFFFLGNSANPFYSVKVKPPQTPLLYAMNIDSLPTAMQTTPSTMGGNLGFSKFQKKLLLFGGSSSTTTQAPSADTWLYDLTDQAWTRIGTPTLIPTALANQPDYSSVTNQASTLTHLPGGRSVFGYVAAPNMALSGFTTNPTQATVSPPIDSTDRIVILGGIGSSPYCPNAGLCTDIHLFNPTYGPEYMDASNLDSPLNLKSQCPDQNCPDQWIQTSHLRLLSNTEPTSQLMETLPQPPPFPPPQASALSFPPAWINFGVAPLLNPNRSTSLLMIGGFYGYTDSAGEVNINPGGGMTISKLLTRWNEAKSRTLSFSNFSFPNHYFHSDGVQAAPAEVSHFPLSIPFWFGGGSLLQGLSLAQNDMILIGGSSCRSYLLDTPSPTCTFMGALSSQYSQYSSYYLSSLFPFTSTTPRSFIPSGSLPLSVGMATARGVDTNNNPFIVAWGGKKNVFSNPTFQSGSSLYFLSSLNETPTWSSISLPSSPPPLVNASMVFSHVTKKFYLFGGYGGPSLQTVGTTWQLTPSGACGTSATNCSFQWVQLNPLCSPTCPEPRRSHRMVEVNYNNLNPTTEPSCTPGSPCSFGIFMEGGTSNSGGLPFSERWLFDPTANGGQGLWQQMTDLPPRKLAMMTDLSFNINQIQNGTTQIKGVEYALLFGGETGLQDASSTVPQASFVPPTLGDTWIFDYQNSNWVKPQLLGMRYKNTIPSSTLSRMDVLASTTLQDPSSVLLAPPPRSGGILITRTSYRPHHDPSQTSTPLKIPEVFLIGGRLKDGRIQTLDQVFKFCMGTSGEKQVNSDLNGNPINAPDNASCDAYDSVTNPLSTAPVADYVGRWLLKTPSMGHSPIGTYLGAGAYDSLYDRILVFGGLMGEKVTQTQTLQSSLTMYEYNPPSGVNSTDASITQGSWNGLPPCPKSPSPPLRYGHKMAFDTSQGGALITGGNSINGTPLTDTWLAIRNNAQTCYQWSQIETSPVSPLPSFSAGALTASTFIPRTRFDAGFYTLSDSACIGYGPLQSTNALISKRGAGGVDIDLDRSQLGSRENIVLHLTYFPFSSEIPQSVDPVSSPYDFGFFKIHLMQIGSSGETIRTVPQPRYQTYIDSALYPQIVPQLHTLSSPGGQVRTEQILIPLSVHPTMNRIRIERFTGSGILIDAALYRLGEK